MPTLVTVPNVELLEVGEDWQTSTGPRTWTHEDLVAAVNAMDDPAVRTPIIKFGHVSKLNDGEPAFGRVENLRLTNNGQTLVGDFVGIPEWIAEVMASAWPRRSIEGAFNWTTATGRNHGFVITACSLLGAAYPAITTLEDIKAVYGADSVESVELVAATGDLEIVTATQKEADVPTEVKAAMSLDNVRKTYYENLGPDQQWWWIREVQLDPPALIVDDDNGGLHRVTFSVSGESVSFDEPVEVVIEYRERSQVAASHSMQNRAVYASRQESRPSLANEENGMTEAQLEVIGLKAGATDEQIEARLRELATKAEGTQEGQGDQQPAPQTAPQTSPAPGESPDVEVRPATAPAEEQPAGAPAGTVVVDEAQWQKIQQDIAAANELVAASKRKEREEFVAAAIKEGKFPPAMRKHYTDLMEKDETGTRQLIQVLARNAVPLQEMGRGDEVAASLDTELYPSSWLPELAGQKGDN